MKKLFNIFLRKTKNFPFYLVDRFLYLIHKSSLFTSKVISFYWFISDFFFPKNLSFPHIQNKKICEKIIFLGGFGHSGSGALLDFLSEFSNVTCIGSHDIGLGSQKKDKIQNYEFNLLRRYGGLIDLSDAFNTRNLNIRDFKLKNFIVLSEFFYTTGNIYNDEFYKITKNFINELIDFKLPVTNSCVGNEAFSYKISNIRNYKNLLNPYLIDKNKQQYRYYLKDLDRNQYFKITNEYFKNILKTIPSSEYLVLDQAISDCNADIDTIKKIVGEFKAVFVYRDPRDVYLTGILNNVEWLPNDVDHFIKHYKWFIENYIKLSHKDFMLIRFEDLVLDYNNQRSLILNFLKLNESNHYKKLQFFNPQISSKNIGLWRKYENDLSVKKIHKKLLEYCYDK